MENNKSKINVILRKSVARQTTKNLVLSLENKNKILCFAQNDIKQSLFKTVWTSVFFILFIFTSNVFSQPQFNDWKYYSEININNTGNTETLTDYSVLVRVDTKTLITQGKMNADGSDIRFTTNFTTDLDYWIEPGIQNEFGINKDSTHLWVKIPSINGSSKSTLYMVYGNSAATAKSNIQTTFIFGDDFDDNSFDAARWETVITAQGQVNEQNQRLEHNSPASFPESESNVHSKQTFTEPVVLEMRFKKGGYVYRGVGLAGSSGAADNNRAWFDWQDWGQIDVSVSVADVDSGYIFGDIYHNNENKWSASYNPEYYLKLIRDNDGSLSFFETIPSSEEDGYKHYEHKFDGVSMPLSTPLMIWCHEHMWRYGSGKTRYEDDIRVRKYSSPEPTTSVGTEFDINGNPTTTLLGEYKTDANTVLLLHMNETSGDTVKDASGQNNNGGATGTTIVDGRFGKARSFGGNIETIDINRSTLKLPVFTAEAWINLNSYNSNPTHFIFSNLHSGNDQGFLLALDQSQKLNFTIMGSPHLFSKSILSVQKWYHVGISYDGMQLKIYINGVEDAATSFSGLSYDSDTFPFKIGNHNLNPLDPQNQFFNGQIDEVRISNIARSSEEFNLQLPPKNLSASVSITSIDLTWQNGGGAVPLMKYYIYRGDDSTTMNLFDSTSQTSFANTGLSSGATYYYRISAVDSTGFEGAKSFAVKGTTATSTTPLLGEYTSDANTVLLLHMNETSGTTVSDASGLNNNGTTARTTIVEGRFGKARMFNSSSDNIQIPNSPSLAIANSDFTLELWVNWTSFVTTYCQIMKKFTSDLASDPGFELGLNFYPPLHGDTIGVTFNISDGIQKKQIGGNLKSLFNHWSQIGIVRQTNELKLYVDGVLNGSVNVAGMGDIDNTNALILGGSENDFTLDEIRFSNIARSPEEFNLQLPPKNLSATSAISAVNLVWENGGGAAPLMKYYIYRGTDSTTMNLFDSTLNTSYSNTGLATATTYFYRVSAVDSTGFEGAKSWAVQTTLIQLPTNIVQIGSGVVRNAHLPIEPSYENSYSQVIYLASEINISGTITQLRWYFAGSSLSVSNKWTIYLGHTTKSSFSAGTDWIPVENMTQVYSETFNSPTTSGWITFDISDFYYNGTDNLVIATDENYFKSDSDSDNFYCTEVGSTRSICYYTNILELNPDPVSPPSGTIQPYIANIQLEFQPSPSVKEGLVAYYPFNDNANDESGNGNDGTISGATTTTDRFGNMGKAYSFDGVSSRIEIPNSPSLNPATAITISAWINVIASTGDHQVVVGKWYGSSEIPQPAYILEFQPNGNIIQMPINGVTTDTYSDASSSDPISFNQWHFVVGTYDGATVNIYVDGVVKCKIDRTGNIPTTSAPLIIGGHNSVGDRNPLNGKIDDVRIYNRALTEDEIASLYHEGGWLVNGVPAIPQNLTATPGNTQVVLKWNKNRESDFLKYRIYMGTTPTPVILKDSSSASITDTTKTITGLTNGTLYYFRVTAMDSSRLESSQSTAVSTAPSANNTPSISLSSAAFAFGSVAPGSSTKRTLTLTNTGTAALTGNVSVTASAGFSIDKTALNITVGNSDSIHITFSPTAAQNYVATLTITHNAAGSPSTVSLSGTGQTISGGPNITPSRSGILVVSNGNFTSTTLATVIISNNGNLNLTGTAQFSGSTGLSITGTTLNVPSLGTHTITLLINSTSIANGIYNGTITITHTAPGGTTLIPVVVKKFNVPSSIPLSKKIFFDNSSDPTSYQLFGLPGTMTPPPASLLTGTYKEQWRMYRDNGGVTNFLEEYDGSSNFYFGPGKGFWILSSKELSVSYSSPNYTSNTGAYPIALQNGWNIISNPFERSIQWDDIKTFNNLPTNAFLYSWYRGVWSLVATVVPYTAYYYNNAGNAPTLLVPYDPNGSLGKQTVSEGQLPIHKTHIAISIESNGQNISTAYAGFDSTSGNDFDNNDYFAPPSSFTASNIVIENKSLTTIQKRLFIEHRKEVGEGQEFNLVVKNISHAQTVLSFDGLENFSTNNVFLYDKQRGIAFDLAQTGTISVPQSNEEQQYRLLIGSNSFVKEVQSKVLLNEFKLYQNYPNPFNPTTTISYSLPAPSQVKVTVFDLLGREVRTVANEFQQNGYYSFTFDARSLSSGVYYYQLRTENFVSTKRMLLVK